MGKSNIQRAARRVQTDHDVRYTLALQCCREVMADAALRDRVDQLRMLGSSREAAMSQVVGASFEFSHGDGYCGHDDAPDCGCGYHPDDIMED